MKTTYSLQCTDATLGTSINLQGIWIIPTIPQRVISVDASLPNFWVAWFLFCLASPLPFSKLPKNILFRSSSPLAWMVVGRKFSWGDHRDLGNLNQVAISLFLDSHFFHFYQIMMMPVLCIFTHGRFQPDLAQAICLIFNLDAPNCLPSDLGASRIIFLPPWPSRIFLDMSDIFLEIF